MPGWMALKFGGEMMVKQCFLKIQVDKDVLVFLFFLTVQGFYLIPGDIFKKIADQDVLSKSSIWSKEYF